MQLQCDHAEEASGYVLGTLSQHDREEFGRHVTECPACQEELETLERLTEVTAPTASPESPAPRHDERSDQLAVRRVEHGRSSIQADHPMLATRLLAAEAANRSRRSVRMRSALVILGVALFVALFIKLGDHSSKDVYYRGQTAWKTAGAAVEINGAAGEVLTDHLPAAPTGDTYELWVLPKHTTHLRFTGVVVNLNSAGEAGVQIPGDIRDDKAVAIYAEPVGGSRAAKASINDHPVAVVYLTGKPRS